MQNKLWFLDSDNCSEEDKVQAEVSNNMKIFVIKEKENRMLIRKIYGINTEGRRKVHESSTLDK